MSEIVVMDANVKVVGSVDSAGELEEIIEDSDNVMEAEVGYCTAESP